MFDAAEREARIGSNHLIDENHACFKFVDEALLFRRIVCPSAAFRIICARSAKVSLRNLGNTSAARRIFSSTCESDRVSNVLSSCPVAGLIVAIAIEDLYASDQHLGFESTGELQPSTFALEQTACELGG